MVDYRIGDLVEIRSGPHSGVCGWVESVDWRALRVSLLQFTYIPNTYGRRDQTKEVAALSLKVQMHLEVSLLVPSFTSFSMFRHSRLKSPSVIILQAPRSHPKSRMRPNSILFAAYATLYLSLLILIFSSSSGMLQSPAFDAKVGRALRSLHPASLR